MVGAIEKAVVILSGGPDSVTVAYWAKSQGYDVSAVTFDYGQKAKHEIEIAAEISRLLGIPHKIIDLSNLSDIYQGVTSLVDKGLDVSSEFTNPIIVPFRNGVFMAVTVAYADGIGANNMGLMEAMSHSTLTADASSTRRSRKQRDWAQRNQ